MFTNFQQVEDWIRDNGFKHWVFYANNPSSKSDSDRYNDKILDSKFYGGDMNEKIAMTQKYLENVNRTVYGVGYQSETANTGGCVCEFRNAGSGMQPTNMMYQPQSIGAPAPVDEKAIEDRIRKQITAEFRAQKLEDERKQFEQERKEFQRDKASAVGMLVQYLKPLIDSKVSGLRNVAGTPYQDAKEDVQAARIVAPEQPTDVQPEAEQDAFTDEEADKLYGLLAEFKQVEPQYMELIEAVVNMAKSGDSTYTMAKQFLLK